MKIKEPIDNLIILLIFLQSILYIFLFPELENPDGFYYYLRVQDGITDNHYLALLSKVNLWIEGTFQINGNNFFVVNPNFEQFNWETLYLHFDYNTWNVILLELFNLFLVFLSIMVLHFLLKRNKKIVLVTKKMLYRITLLYYLYPTVSYLITGITSDFPLYLYQPFFIFFIFAKKHTINISFLLYIYFFIDSGAIINIYFLLVIFIISVILKLRIKYKKTSLLTLVPLIFGVINYTSRYFLIQGNLSGDLINIMRFSQNLNSSFINKIIYFVISAFYLTGHGSFITFPIFYLIFVVTLCIVFYKSYKYKKNDELFLYLIASLFTVFSLIIIYPTYAHVKYYLFFILFIIMGFFTIMLKDKNISSNKNYFIFALLNFFHNVILIVLIHIKVY